MKPTNTKKSETTPSPYKIILTAIGVAIIWIAADKFADRSPDRPPDSSGSPPELEPTPLPLDSKAPSKPISQAAQPSQSEMRSIEEQIREAIYHFSQENSTITAANHANGFTTTFDNQSGALTVTPIGDSEDDWHWQLSAVSGESSTALSEANRLTVQHSEALTEWYVNEPRGIEQGFTVSEQPPEGRIAMRLTTNLSPTIKGKGDAQEIHFNDPTTAETKLRYAELFVTDATGDRVPAKMELAGNPSRNQSHVLALVLDDSEALYPITVDPIITTFDAELQNPEFREGRRFQAVAISGDVMVAASHDFPDDQVGKALVYERGPNDQWEITATLIPSPPTPGFGSGRQSIDIQNDRIVVGADSFDFNDAANSVFVFERNRSGSGQAWIQSARIQPDQRDDLDVDPTTGFGKSLSLSGDVLVVAAPQENQGLSYFFEEIDGQWRQIVRLTSTSTTAVAVSGTTVAIGDSSDLGRVQIFERDASAPLGWHRGQTIEIENSRSFDRHLSLDGDVLTALFTAASGVQSLVVFERSSDGVWRQTASLIERLPNETLSYFGIRVSGQRIGVAAEFVDEVADNQVVVFEKHTPTTGHWGETARWGHTDVGSPEIFSFDLSGDRTVRTDSSGRAVIHELRDGDWGFVATAQPGEPQTNNGFAQAMAMEEGVLVVGAPRFRDVRGREMGAAFVFQRDGRSAHTWRLKQILRGSGESAEGDLFGASVATVHGDWIAVGAPGHDRNGIENTGAAYLFRNSTFDGWNLHQAIHPFDSELASGQLLGYSVGISHFHYDVLAGSPGHNNGVGRTFVFSKSFFGHTWEQFQIIRAPSGTRGVGQAVVAHGASALIGAPDSDDGNGFVHVLKRTDRWRTVTSERGTRQGLFGATLAISDGHFGLIGEPGAARAYAVGLHGGRILRPVLPPNGAPLSGYASALALSGNTAYIGAPQSGVVHAFVRESGNHSRPIPDPAVEDGEWVHHQTLYPEHPINSGGSFGGTLAGSGRNIAIGIPSPDLGKVEVHRMGARQWRPSRSRGAPVVTEVTDVALDGDTLVVVSAALDETIVFDRTQGTRTGWRLAQRLPHTLGNFLPSVDVSGDHIVVRSSDVDERAGALIFYSRTSSSGLQWTTNKIIPDRQPNLRNTLYDQVAICGDWAVAGERRGDRRLHFYRYFPDQGWLHQTKGFVTIDDVDRVRDVAIHGEQAVLVGTTKDPNPQQVCIVLRYTGPGTSSWRIHRKFNVSPSASTIALHGDIIAVGDIEAGANGEVWVYEPDIEGDWQLRDTLKPTPFLAENGNKLPIIVRGFGRDIDMEDELLVIGMSEFGVDDPGSAYVFERRNQRWSLAAAFAGDNAAFGRSVTVSGTTIAVASNPIPVVEGGSSVHIFEVDRNREAFNEWLRGHFGNAVVEDDALEETVWGENADPDGDGVSNLREAYHGMNPLVSDSTNADLKLIDDRLYWRRGLQTAGIRAKLQWSSNMQEWFGMGDPSGPVLSTRIASEEFGHFIMESPIVNSDLTKCFFRLIYRD